MNDPQQTALERRLQNLKTEDKKGVIPYFTAGDPDLACTQDILLAMSEAGVAALEVGIPFSDPIADGPTIQASSQRALQGHASLDAILSMLENIQHDLVPTVIFSYLNPIDRMGYDVFARRARAAGASGLLLTDATPGTEPALERALAQHHLDIIRLVAPTTPPSRLPIIADGASGFLYIIARRGVTGAGHESREAEHHIQGLRALTSTPLYVGFGVRTPEDAHRIAAYADGVIVGSALVEKLHALPRGKRPQAAADYMRELIAGANGDV